MSDSKEDFVSFEKALRDLKLHSEQLKKMVSQGDIRAFRVGDSMQFRSEDIAALRSRSSGEDELVFADALEDDTGMVTEELSDDETLLVEDDDEEEDIAPARAAPRVATKSRREAIEVEKAQEPGWVVAVAILGFVIALWGALIAWDISTEARPGDSIFTKPWAGDKK
ncbi:MAG: hypothetical protein KDC87_11300 [Planctomycetes bacterium]|nr:hypothetical protein [Planctomycetota bacterium]MCB9868479.1 hypothetical protein [Planctomycetota bacterium]